MRALQTQGRFLDDGEVVMQWAEQTSKGKTSHWSYKGDAADLIAIGMEGREVKALKLRLESGIEVIAYFDEHGTCQDCEYEVLEQ